MADIEELKQAYLKFYNEEAKDIIEKFNSDKKNYTKKVTFDSVEEYEAYDLEKPLKEKLMQKFLAIFGDFKWQKKKSFFNIKDSIIIPNLMSMDMDDCITGKFEDINVKITEVFFGMNAGIANQQIIMAIIAMLLFLLMLAPFIAVILPIPEDFKALIFIKSFWLTVKIFFLAGPIILIGYLVNSDRHGLVIEIDMPKKFNGETVIFENTIINRIMKNYTLDKFEKTKLEDPEFNKKYSIYTTDQVEARYILTTAFIERIKNIKFAFNAMYLRMRFKDNRITIFAPVYKDLFCMVKSGKKTGMKTFHTMFYEIYSILSLIDELKLNIKTGL